MKRLIIHVEGEHCTAWLCYGSQIASDYAKFTISEGTSWKDLQDRIHQEMKLDQHPPPGMATQGDEADVCPPLPWEPLQGGFGLPGYGWGFYLPVVRKNEVAELYESCCGFRDRSAAEKAAKTMRHNHTRITGDLPGAVFEIFTLDGVYAFLDYLGEIHATFPTHAEARGCASKIEAAQMQTPTPKPAA